MEYRRFNGETDTGVFATAGKTHASGSRMTISVLCPRDGHNWKYLLLGYSYKIEEDKEEYLLEPDSIGDTAFDVELKCTIDADSFPFRPTNWYIRAVYEKNGELTAVKVISTLARIKDKEILANDFSCTDGSGHILFPCTTRGGYFGFRYREKTKFDGMDTKRLELKAAREYQKNKELYDNKKIYLIYEKRCAKAQDNGYYLFKYCMENDVEKYLGRSIYYVITEDAPDRAKLEPYKDHVVTFGSYEHMLYLQASRLLISPDSRAHAYIWQYDRSLIGQKMTTKRHVFLGHGVLALKKLNESFQASKMNSVMTTATSQSEADICVEYLGFRKHEAVVTGYARFDGLEDSSSGCREILIMPTHRSWVFGVDRETFVSSEYFRRYMELLNSPELEAILDEYDLTANFYLHPSIAEHLDAFSSTCGRVNIIQHGTVALDDLMMRCRLLLTDYSSVCWDLYYMGKPSVFYQYDVREYMDTWGSYIDLEKETPGERAVTLERLLECIRESAERDFALDTYWQSRREENYQFIDRNNCRRIVEALKERNF